MTNILLRTGKRLLQKPMQDMGLDVVRRVADDGPQMPCLELLLQRSVLAGEAGAVVQVGANDGKMDDPVYRAITKLNLPAILIEPLPNLFAQLEENYRAYPRVRFEKCAISTTAEDRTIYRVRPDPSLPAWVHGLASFDKQVLLKHRTWAGAANIVNCIEEVSVPVRTLGQILSKHQDIGPILALQIDTEGHDFEVVKSAVDAGLTPRLIAYEHKHLSYNDQVLCRGLLENLGYSFLTLPTDTIAIRYDGECGFPLPGGEGVPSQP